MTLRMCPACGLADHATLKKALESVRELEDCNEDTYAMIVHAQDYIAHLEAQVAALREACDQLLRCSLPRDISGVAMVEHARAAFRDTTAAVAAYDRQRRIEGAEAMNEAWQDANCRTSEPPPPVAVVDAMTPKETP